MTDAMDRSVHLWRVLALSLCLGLFAPSAGRTAVLEEEVKAAYLLRFLPYVQWPAGALADDRAPLKIGLLGADAVAGALERAAAERNIGAHPIEVVRLAPGQRLEGLHVLFVGLDAASWVPIMSPRARAASVLLVSESEGALEEGSDINFVMVTNHVRFEVDLQHTESAHLKLASGLLSVALRVRNGP